MDNHYTCRLYTYTHYFLTRIHPYMDVLLVYYTSIIGFTSMRCSTSSPHSTSALPFTQIPNLTSNVELTSGAAMFCLKSFPPILVPHILQRNALLHINAVSHSHDSLHPKAPLKSKTSLHSYVELHIERRAHIECDHVFWNPSPSTLVPHMFSTSVPYSTSMFDFASRRCSAWTLHSTSTSYCTPMLRFTANPDLTSSATTHAFFESDPCKLDSTCSLPQWSTLHR